MNNNERNERYLNLIDTATVGVHEVIGVGCKMCGRCCHDIDIILSPEDVFRGAKFLGISCIDFLKKAVRFHIGEISNLPVAMLRMDGDAKKACVFLDGNKCSIHGGKPSTCALYPLGRYCSFDGDTWSVKYVMQEDEQAKCGDTKPVKVGDFLDAFGLREGEEGFLVWTETIRDLSKVCTELVEFMQSEYGFDKDGPLMERFFSVVIYTMYANFDTEKEFLPQLKEVKKNLETDIEKFREFVKEAVVKATAILGRE